MIACLETQFIARASCLGLLLCLLNACSHAPPATSLGDAARVPAVDASVVEALRGVSLALPTAPAAPAIVSAPMPAPAVPAQAPEPAPVAVENPPDEALVMASSAAYFPNLSWPLPEATHQTAIQAAWLAPLYPPDADVAAVRDRLVDALRGAGYGTQWQVISASGGGILLVTPVERVAADGSARWASPDTHVAGQRYRSFVFQLGMDDSPLGQVLVYEATRPERGLAGFQASPTATPVEHLKQAGILLPREVLVLASAR